MKSERDSKYHFEVLESNISKVKVPNSEIKYGLSI